MQRFAELERKSGEQVAINTWTNFTELHCWFRITPALNTAPTFVRDKIEAYYVDAMDEFIKATTTHNWEPIFNIMNVPFLGQQDALQGWRWNLFHPARQCQTEIKFWSNHRMMVRRTRTTPHWSRRMYSTYEVYNLRPRLGGAVVIPCWRKHSDPLSCFTIKIRWWWPPATRNGCFGTRVYKYNTWSFSLSNVDKIASAASGDGYYLLRLYGGFPSRWKMCMWTRMLWTVDARDHSSTLPTGRTGPYGKPERAQ